MRGPDAQAAGRVGMPAALLARAAAQHGVVSRAQAAEYGLTPPRIRRRVEPGQLDVVGRRVMRIARSSRSFEQRCMAAVLDTGSGAVVSGRTAAVLWGLPGYSQGPIEIRQLRGCTSSRRSELIMVRETRILPASHVASQRDVPVTTCARMLAELAATMPPGRVERTLDDALARRLTSVQLVAAVVGDLSSRGRAGSSVLRHMVLDRADNYRPVESGNERRFLEVLERAGVAAPAKRQINLGDDSGFIGRADFLDDEVALDIEIDSDLFHSAKLDREADARRDARLRAAGFTVLRISEEILWMDPHRIPMLVQSARKSAGQSLALRRRVPKSTVRASPARLTPLRRLGLSPGRPASGCRRFRRPGLGWSGVITRR